MQMIAWGWSFKRKSQSYWAGLVRTTTGGSAISDMVRVVNASTGYDRSSRACTYITLDTASYGITRLDEAPDAPRRRLPRAAGAAPDPAEDATTPTSTTTPPATSSSAAATRAAFLVQPAVDCGDDDLDVGMVARDLSTPSGAAMIAIRRTEVAPAFFTVLIAAAVEFPVASIGSSRITSRSATSAGSSRSTRPARGSPRRGTCR